MYYLEDLKAKKLIKGMTKELYIPEKNNSFDIEATNWGLDEDTYRLLNSFYSFEYNDNGVIDFGEYIDELYQYIDAINDRDFKKPLTRLINSGFVELYKDEFYNKTDFLSYKFKVFYPTNEIAIENIEEKNNIKNIDINNIEYDIVNKEILNHLSAAKDINKLVKENINKMLNAYSILDRYTFKEITLKGITNIGLEQLGQVEYNFEDKMEIRIDDTVCLEFEDFITTPYTYIQHLFPKIYSEINLGNCFLYIKFEETWDGITTPKFDLTIH